MIPRRWLKLSLILALLAIAGVNHLVQERLTERRLTLTDAPPLENAPPALALSVVVLGGFRGLLADMLFLRQGKMQTNGNYFELVQLARWTIQLQPRFTEAISYSVWNLAYNVSVNFSQPEERWRWVNAAIELVRDEALPQHPGDPKLYQQLGWIYQHKIGQNLDDMNYYYKRQVALQMIEMLGSGPYDWQALAEAPQDPDAMVAALGDDAAEFAAALHQEGLSLSGLEQSFRESATLPPAIAEFAKRRKCDELLVLYLRSRWLLSKSLDPVVLYEIDQHYGPLDFRTAQAHGIYWAYQGLKHTPDGSEVFLECERMIFHCMSRSVEIGRVSYLPDTTLKIHLSPNLDIVDEAREAYLNAIKNHDRNGGIKSGYVNFMIDCIRALYIGGRTEDAQRFLEIMRSSKYAEGSERFVRSLDEFVLIELEEDVNAGGEHQALPNISGFLQEAFSALGRRDFKAASNWESLAQRSYSKYQTQFKSERDTKRRGLPPYTTMKQVSLQQIQLNEPAVFHSLYTELQRLAAKRGDTLEGDGAPTQERDLLEGLLGGDSEQIQRN